MGEISEGQYQQWQGEYDVGDPDEGFWVTREGKRIRILKMTDEHIRNVLAWAKREGKSSPRIDEVQVEAEQRGLKLE